MAKNYSSHYAKHRDRALEGPMNRKRTKSFISWPPRGTAKNRAEHGVMWMETGWQKQTEPHSFVLGLHSSQIQTTDLAPKVTHKQKWVGGNLVAPVSHLRTSYVTEFQLTKLRGKKSKIKMKMMRNVQPVEPNWKANGTLDLPPM